MTILTVKYKYGFATHAEEVAQKLEALEGIKAYAIPEELSVEVVPARHGKERRVFYIDVGNLPKEKAEQYVKDLMDKSKNESYESYYMPIREGHKFSKIEFPD